MIRIPILCCLFAALVFAQPLQTTGSIRGSVLSAGSLVPGASVSITNNATGELLMLRADASGEFTASRLAPGNYTIRGKAEGFASSEPIQVSVVPGKSQRIELVLAKPTPVRATPRTIDAGVAAQPSGKYVTVPIFYATDRKQEGDSFLPSKFYGGNRRERTNGDPLLEFGVCEVSIPWSHHVGELETPSWMKLEFQSDPTKHVQLLSVTPYDQELYFATIRRRVSGAPLHDAFVFIHGYNTSFENAARRTAQIAHDLKFSGAPILYSWPSQNEVVQYIADENNVEWTSGHLEEFLKLVSERTGATTIHLIAHSMGSRALTSALKAMPVKTPPQFREVILAAPDIDAGVFTEMAEGLKGKANRITLYASSKDYALEASRTVHGLLRAGDSEQMVVVDGVDSIDASHASTDVLGHGYVFNSSILFDIESLFRFGKPPSQRERLRVQQMGKLLYWMLDR